MPQDYYSQILSVTIMNIKGDCHMIDEKCCDHSESAQIAKYCCFFLYNSSIYK